MKTSNEQNLNILGKPEYWTKVNGVTNFEFENFMGLVTDICYDIEDLNTRAAFLKWAKTEIIKLPEMVRYEERDILDEIEDEISDILQFMGEKKFNKIKPIGDFKFYKSPNDFIPAGTVGKSVEATGNNFSQRYALIEFVNDIVALESFSELKCEKGKTLSVKQRTGIRNLSSGLATQRGFILNQKEFESILREFRKRGYCLPRSGDFSDPRIK